jgi:hypothetical protein
MSDIRALLERKQRELHAPPGSFERLLRRRDRKRRNQRILAGSVGIAVFVAAIWFVTSGGRLDRTQTPAVPGPTQTGPTQTGPGYSSWHVTEKDFAVGKSFMDAWVQGDGEAAAAMFKPEGTFDGFLPEILPALHDWFRAGGWTFRSDGCGKYVETSEEDNLGLGIVSCGFTYENDLTRALEMDPVGHSIAFIIDAGSIDAATTQQTEWYGSMGDGSFNLFRSPNPQRLVSDRFGAVWDVFIDWISSRHPDEFGRMYDAGRGYPLLDPRSIRLWERYTDEFVASPQALRRSFTGWMASRSFDVQAGRICVSADDRFWATEAARRVDHQDPNADLDDLAVFYSTLTRIAEERLAELRALPLKTEADRATMVEFVPLAEYMIEILRQQAAAAATGDRERVDSLGGLEMLDLQHQLDGLIPGCWFSLGG